MGLFGKFFKDPDAGLSEEEKALRAEAEKLHGEAVKKLKDRALAIEANVRAVAGEKDFDSLSHAQFVKYAHVLGEDELVEAIGPGHYTNVKEEFDGPGHILFLRDRFIFVADEWKVNRRSFSYRYKDLGDLEKNPGIFKSVVRFPCKKVMIDSKEEWTPENGEDQMIFYLKSEYKLFTQNLETRLRTARLEETAEGAAEVAARKEEAAAKALAAVRAAQEAADRARREAEEAKAIAAKKKEKLTDEEVMKHVDKY